MFGALVNGPIADALSRRWTILLANAVFLTGSIIQAASVNVSMIFAGRFVAGLSIGQLSMVVPLYLSELAPPNLRGALGATQQLGITVGIMISFWLDYGTQHIGGTGNGQSPMAWRLSLALQVQLELLEIKVAAEFERETTATLYPDVTSRFRLTVERYKSLFTVRHLNRRLIIACLLQIIQQFTGINAIIYYAPRIFQNIGLSGDSIDLLATGVVGVINFFSTIPAILIGCVNWIVPSEIFPPGVRSQAVGVAIGTNWLSNFIVALITHRMLQAITFRTFYFFLAFCIILVVWVVFFVSETKGTMIEEMDRLFGGSQGAEDMEKIEAIRRRLGSAPANVDAAKEEAGFGVSEVEKT
ncbi:Sugar transport protein MST4 [Colletotrichum orbiculare MAFF 240422]|uniref:Sugar transport protein MST4 n=1 Tax=Colletotrichum orbiculare (strain 104-T / ATCC 96160 / CBS 514.97 / LARS 414 / MAFF 240422) TaxID=1213857 RepID=A0A484FEB8_COLOR|nr:Sugar transport protein MST4 [Colletotrichum orbiculare MAFF 240422]